MRDDTSVIKDGLNKLLTFVRAEQEVVTNFRSKNTCNGIDFVCNHVMCPLLWRLLKLYKLKQRFFVNTKFRNSLKLLSELFVIGGKRFEEADPLQVDHVKFKKIYF